MSKHDFARSVLFSAGILVLYYRFMFNFCLDQSKGYLDRITEASVSEHLFKCHLSSKSLKRILLVVAQVLFLLFFFPLLCYYLHFAEIEKYWDYCVWCFNHSSLKDVSFLKLPGCLTTRTSICWRRCSREKMTVSEGEEFGNF